MQQFPLVCFLKKSRRKWRREGEQEVDMWVTSGSYCELPRNQRRRHSVAAPSSCAKLGQFWPWIWGLIMWICFLQRLACVLDTILYTMYYTYLPTTFTDHVIPLFPILKTDMSKSRWCFLSCTNVPSST